MRKIELDQAQAEVLSEALARILSDLSVEIADTDLKSFRDNLKSKRDRLKEISDMLI